MVRAVLALWLALGMALCSLPARAHMMVAQKGTLNFEAGGAYLLVALPVSAFTGFDDDGDQLLSLPELQRHAPLLQQQVSSGLRLLSNGQAVPFELLLMNTSPPDETPGAPARHLVVMGRYVLPGEAVSHAGSDYRVAVNLFGQASDERQLDLAFTRQGRAQTLGFTPETPDRALFTAGPALLAEQLRSGAVLVLAGADHLLFLLVVLADAVGARRGWRHGLALLTVFTLGHGITLAATALGGLSLPASQVEPAIAASIVLMALFSLWQQRQARRWAPAWQLLLVWGCALVHGLGLGGALQAQGWQGADLLWALAGFNLGVEAAQLAVAAAAVAALGLARQWAGPAAAPALAQIGSLAAAAMGVWWWVERAAVLA
jgi:HupE / UreJ protein